MPDEPMRPKTGASGSPEQSAESELTEQPAQPERRGFLSRFFGGFREVTYGMAAHDMTRYALRSRASMEHLFILITMGDLLGVPILPPYYSLRLLPYVVPQISTWKRRMLREKDLTDAMA